VLILFRCMKAVFMMLSHTFSRIVLHWGFLVKLWDGAVTVCGSICQNYRILTESLCDDWPWLRLSWLTFEAKYVRRYCKPHNICMLFITWNLWDNYNLKDFLWRPFSNHWLNRTNMERTRSCWNGCLSVMPLTNMLLLSIYELRCWLRLSVPWYFGCSFYR